MKRTTPEWLTRWRLPGRGRGGGPAPDWLARIEAVMANLEQMNRATEADFLAITNKLGKLQETARAISAQTRDIAGSLTGESGNSAGLALTAILHEARGMGRSATAANPLTGIRESAGRIRRSLSGFQHVGPQVHAMTTLAEIETAHLGGSGRDLGHLAQALRAAGVDIQTRVERILDGVAVLEARVQSAFEEVSESDRRSLQALPALLTSADRGLEELRARQEQAVLSMSRVASHSDRLAKTIGDIVASIQFHDITRQQVEHVVDSLRRIGEASQGSSRCPAEAAQVIEVQLAQLAHAAAEFGKAVREIQNGLANGADQVNAMVAESATLLGPGDGREAGSYVQMEDRLQAIAGAAAGCKDLDRRTRAAMQDLRQTVETLGLSADEVHGVELRLRWLAINAAVSAAHVGTAGEPVAAVAAAMGRLLAECEACSGGADDTIQAVAAAVQSALEGSAEAEPVAGDAWLDRLRAAIGELHRWHELAGASGGEIARTASSLSAELEALQRSLSAGQIFSSTTETCRGLLRGIGLPEGGRRPAGDRRALPEWEQQYTMQAERDIHEAVIAVAATPALAGAPAGAATSTALGDNVELF